MLRQSDRARALSFDTIAGVRDFPKIVNSLSFRPGLKTLKSYANSIWKNGIAGLQADSQIHYAAMDGFQMRF